MYIKNIGLLCLLALRYFYKNNLYKRYNFIFNMIQVDTDEFTAGVYIIFNPLLRRFYIGQSENISQRITQHFGAMHHFFRQQKQGNYERAYNKLAKYKYMSNWFPHLWLLMPIFKQDTSQRNRLVVRSRKLERIRLENYYIKRYTPQLNMMDKQHVVLSRIMAMNQKIR